MCVWKSFHQAFIMISGYKALSLFIIDNPNRRRRRRHPDNKAASVVPHKGKSQTFFWYTIGKTVQHVVYLYLPQKGFTSSLSSQ